MRYGVRTSFVILVIILNAMRRAGVGGVETRSPFEHNLGVFFPFLIPS